jgi:hypothetical protein
MAQALKRMHMNCRECDRRFTTFFERNQNGEAVTPQLFIVAAMFGAIGLAAELDSVIPLFCIVLASFAYVLRRGIKGGERRGRPGNKSPECFFHI